MEYNCFTMLLVSAVQHLESAIYIYAYIPSLFSLRPLLRFSFFSLVFCSLGMRCLCINFFLTFFLLGVLLVSYICGLMSIIYFWKCEVIISSNTSFSSLFLFFLVFPLCLCYFLFKLSHSSWIFCSALLILVFPFVLRLLSFCWHWFKLTDASPSADSIHERMKSILFFCYIVGVFVTRISFEFFSWSVHLPAYISYLFLHAAHFSIRIISILCLVVLNSRCDNSNISTISVSHSGAGSIS